MPDAENVSFECTCNKQKKVTIKIKKNKENAKIPTRGSEVAAGYDLYAAIDTPIKNFPGTTELIDTGLSIACPENYWVGIYARSGFATKQGERPANCVGIIDPDYRGPVMVALYNDSDTSRIIRPGDRIAQMVVHELISIDFKEEEELDSTDRGKGGFGSTGK